MTTPVSGSSLPQARDVHQHNHFHNSNTGDNHLHNHLHTHQHHARSHHRDASTSSQRGHKRTDSEPTIIVETVSVLQVIDSTGSTVTLQTLSQSNPTSALPATTTAAATVSDAIVDPSSGGIVSALGLPTSYPGTSDDEGDGLSTSSSAIDPTVTPSGSSMPTSFPTLSYSPLTSTPLSGSPVFPSLAGVTNTTQGMFF